MPSILKKLAILFIGTVLGCSILIGPATALRVVHGPGPILIWVGPGPGPYHPVYWHSYCGSNWHYWHHHWRCW